MPARKRKRRDPEHPDPVVRFGRALKDAEERERAEIRRLQSEREEAKRRAELAALRAAQIARANQRLDEAIAAVKRARADHRSTDAADQDYRAAKAAVVELETGARPDWAPKE